MKRNAQLNIINSTKLIATAFIVSLALTGCGGNDMLGTSMSRQATYSGQQGMAQVDAKPDDMSSGYCPVIVPVVTSGVYNGSLVIEGTSEIRHLTLTLAESDKGLTGTLLAEQGSDYATAEVIVQPDGESVLIRATTKPEGTCKPLLAPFEDQMQITLTRSVGSDDLEGYWMQSRHRLVVGDVSMRLMTNPIR